MVVGAGVAMAAMVVEEGVDAVVVCGVCGGGRMIERLKDRTLKLIGSGVRLGCVSLSLCD